MIPTGEALYFVVSTISLNAPSEGMHGQVIDDLGENDFACIHQWFLLLKIQEVLRPSGLSYAEFVEKGYLHGPERFRKYLSSGFRTPSTKVEISLSLARKFGLPALPNFSGLLEEDDPAYPLILTSCKSRYYLHSSYRWLETLRKYRPKPKTEIHPVTAAKHGIEEGDEVIIETRNGSIVQHAHLTDRIHPRVINTAYGWWFPEAGAASFYEWEKSNYNMLTSSENLGQAFGTPNLKGIGCRIKPIR